MYKKIKDKAQRIIDYFFTRGVRVSKKDYDFILSMFEPDQQECKCQCVDCEAGEHCGLEYGGKCDHKNCKPEESGKVEYYPSGDPFCPKEKLVAKPTEAECEHKGSGEYFCVVCRQHFCKNCIYKHTHSENRHRQCDCVDPGCQPKAKPTAGECECGPRTPEENYPGARIFVCDLKKCNKLNSTPKADVKATRLEKIKKAVYEEYAGLFEDNDVKFLLTKINELEEKLGICNRVKDDNDAIAIQWKRERDELEGALRKIANRKTNEGIYTAKYVEAIYDIARQALSKLEEDV